jgi:beta-lactamase superfamily II metal-dependent hydrolase
MPQIKQRPPKSAQAKAATPIRIRMYDVGFGDAFLLLIPGEQGDHRVLFDCGSIAQGSSPMGEVVNRIVQDVTDADGTPRIDVVVMSHRHRDHVSGFAQAEWDGVEVKEVWMPWTEDPKDPLAREIRDIQSRFASSLDASLSARLAAAAPGSSESDRIAALQEIAMNAMSNEDAMRTLHEGFLGRPLRRFLPKADPEPGSFETAALPGVMVHILGPSRDKDVIAEMDPPAGRSYLRLANEEISGRGIPEPFNANWWVTPAEFASASDWKLAPPSDQERSQIKEESSGGDELLAATLDGAVNGTSLMLVLQIGKTHVLFPGDAQWGTWRVAMEDPTLVDLMKRSTFYKIGHHGSHNATPKQFVENIMGPDVWAMASTKHRGSWPIPKPELMSALADHSAILARSDEPPKGKSKFTVGGKWYIECALPG